MRGESSEARSCEDISCNQGRCQRLLEVWCRATSRCRRQVRRYGGPRSQCIRKLRTGAWSLSLCGNQRSQRDPVSALHSAWAPEWCGSDNIPPNAWLVENRAKQGETEPPHEDIVTSSDSMMCMSWEGHRSRQPRMIGRWAGRVNDWRPGTGHTLPQLGRRRNEVGGVCAFVHCHLLIHDGSLVAEGGPPHSDTGDVGRIKRAEAFYRSRCQTTRVVRTSHPKARRHGVWFHAWLLHSPVRGMGCCGATGPSNRHAKHLRGEKS